MNLERLQKDMQEGCQESAELLFKEAIRLWDLKLLILLQKECEKKDWKELNSKAFCTAVGIDVSRMLFIRNLEILDNA